MSENTPQRIGDYEIIRELGHGGMGKVFQVRNVLTDRVEAMKVVLPDLAGRSDFVSRFIREIKTLAGLDHPNIATLRTAFTAGDQFVMIMEYVEGVTLADKLQRGPFSTADALNYTSQALSALSYAHSKHVIHRDIKPGNMMLTPQGVVKLMDFGLARSVDEVGLTATGATLGSLDYASPEQVQSLTTDERSDLYSVGVSLYQMVTGKRMFSATSSFSLMQAQVKEIPRPPIEIVPTIPKPLNEAIMQSVAKDPALRFQSADAFRNALSQIAAGDAPATSVPADIPAMATARPLRIQVLLLPQLRNRKATAISCWSWGLCSSLRSWPELPSTSPASIANPIKQRSPQFRQRPHRPTPVLLPTTCPRKVRPPHPKSLKRSPKGQRRQSPNNRQSSLTRPSLRRRPRIMATVLLPKTSRPNSKLSNESASLTRWRQRSTILTAASHRLRAASALSSSRCSAMASAFAETWSPPAATCAMTSPRPSRPWIPATPTAPATSWTLPSMRWRNWRPSSAATSDFFSTCHPARGPREQSPSDSKLRRLRGVRAER